MGSLVGWRCCVAAGVSLVAQSCSWQNIQIDNVYCMWSRYPTCVHEYVFEYLLHTGGGRVVRILSVDAYVFTGSYGWYISCMMHVHIYTLQATTNKRRKQRRLGGGSSARALLGGRPRKAVLAQWPGAARKSKAKRMLNSALAISRLVFVSMHLSVNLTCVRFIYPTS